MGRRQSFALLHPLRGREKSGDPRFVMVQAHGDATWKRRLTFRLDGGPELVGPCWHVEVWVERAGAPLLVKDWRPEDQEFAKVLALRAIENVGHGEELDVHVRDHGLEVWRLARTVEAASSSTMGVQ